TETCRELLVSGLLKRQHLTPEALLELKLPAGVSEIYRERIRRLAQSPRLLLEWVAASRAGAEIDQLAALCGESPSAIRESLLELIRSGLIQAAISVSGEAYQICHPVLMDLIQESLEPAELKGRHRTWLDLLEK